MENDIYDSRLEIEWLINEESHIKDPDSLHEVEQRTVEITNVTTQPNEKGRFQRQGKRPFLLFMLLRWE